MRIQTLQNWLEQRLGISEIFGFLTKKTVPQHKHTIWYYTGSSIFLFFIIQIITGIMLAFYYKPTLEEANASVARIITEIPLGWIIRSLHSWSATFMIAFVLIHLLSIWLIKAYRNPREMTWITGVFLLFASLGFGFTGYLLPWDDLSLSATKIGTDIPRTIPLVGAEITKFLRGGEDVTGDTLTRFFSFHVCVLPLAILLLFGLHIFLIQKHGMSLPLSHDGSKNKVKELPFWPNFVLRESVVWLVLIGTVMTLAVFVPTPLGNQADLMAPAPEGIKPEWYFLFLFQTLKLFPAKIFFLSGETLTIFFVLFTGGLFLFLPLIDNRPEDKKGKVITGISCLFILYALIMTVWSLL